MQGLFLFSSSRHVIFLRYAGTVLGSSEEPEIMKHSVSLQEFPMTARVKFESQSLNHMVLGWPLISAISLQHELV